MIEDLVNADPVPETAGKMFGCKDILKITQLFHEADVDGGGGLDIEEFEVLLNMMYPSVDKDGIKALHMKIDTNCDGSVDIGELLTYLLDKDEALENMRNEVFPRPIQVTSLNCHKTIKGVAFMPQKCDRKPGPCSEDSQVGRRPYKKGNYVTVSSNGVLNLWTENFDLLRQIVLCKGKERLPFSHAQKMYINGIAYITDLGQLAVSTDKEIRFYDCNDFHYLFQMNHSLLVEENSASTMNYWSNGTKAIFSFGDVKGCLYVFVSNNVEKYQLFNKSTFEKDDDYQHPVAYVSSLLRNTSNNYMCFKVPVFSGICSQIRYFPDIDTLAVCGESSKKLVLVALPKSAHTRVTPCVFTSPRKKAFFSCVEYCPLEKILLTGGTDGVLRLWNPQESRFCKIELEGHSKPIIDVVFNHRDKILLSISEDKNVRVWSKNGWICQQSFIVEEMGHLPISSLCYNTCNNELILANSDIGKLFGRGTDVFADLLRSHEKPLCCALYHQIFNQVVSVCQDGMVMVWSTLTGQAVMRFRVLPDKCVGHTIMTFDEPQRRLITVTADGKVQLWNFNNGAQLAVLPVELPNGMRSIVCRENRVFVAGRNRNIFDLDIEGENNRCMQHDYLTDVSSMDFLSHQLFTTSSNGNTVVWDTKTNTAVFWLNGSISPVIQPIPAPKKIIRHRTHTPGLPEEYCRKNIRFNRTKTTPSKKSRALAKTNIVVNSGPIIVCLKTRVARFNRATLLISANSHIYAWSTGSQEVLLAKFRVVMNKGVVLTAMSTDAHEQKLLAEDSAGNVYLWDIHNFAYDKYSLKEPFEIIDGCPVSLCPPLLLGYWKSHPTAGGASVMFDCAGNVITAGLDCNVRLWTNSGHHIGIFGRDEWEIDPSTLKDANQEQAGSLATAETGSPVPLSQSEIFRLFFPEIPGQTSPPYQPDLTDNQLYAQYNSLEKADQIKETAGQKHVSIHPDVVERDSEHTSKPSGPGLFPPIPDKVCLTCHQKPMKPSPPPISHTSRSEHTAEPVRFPPISDTAQLTNSGLKPHPPQTPPIGGRPDRRGSSLQTATPGLNETKPKYGRTLHYQPRDALRDSGLSPRPPNTVPVVQGSKQRRKHVDLPPINTPRQMQKSPGAVKQRSGQTAPSVPPISSILDMGQLTSSLIKPFPPQTPPSRGRNDMGSRGSSPQTATPCVTEMKPEFGPVLQYQPKDASREGDLVPFPPNTVPVMQGSERKQKHVRLPPILPTTHPNRQISLGGRSEHTAEPVRFPPISDTGQLTNSLVKPHPPQTPSPVSDSVEPVHHHTQLKPHVPQIRQTSNMKNLPRFSRVKEFI